MKNSTILTADVLDIIFDGRNKSYGAYELRKHYGRRLWVSIAVMLTIVSLSFLGYVLGNSRQGPQARVINIPPDQILSKVDIPDHVEPPPPPPRQPEPPQQVATIKNLVPRVVPDKDVTPADEVPPVDEMENVKIGSQTRDGVEDDGTMAPPMTEAGNGTGVIEAPKKAEPEGPFLKVEIESSYPGGDPAWKRFLNKNLGNNYPQEAVDQGIEGIVVIQFVVDSVGVVSNVQAISGPEELRATAEWVIRKSGKWIPAIQNHRKVPSYKRQPIVFKLFTE